MLPVSLSLDKYMRSRLSRLQEDADNLSYTLDELSGTEFEEVLVELKKIESEIDRIERRLYE